MKDLLFYMDSCALSPTASLLLVVVNLSVFKNSLPSLCVSGFISEAPARRTLRRRAKSGKVVCQIKVNLRNNSGVTADAEFEGSKSHQCKICNKVFSTERCLERHVLSEKTQEQSGFKEEKY